jgi:hypothetical protein
VYESVIKVRLEDAPEKRARDIEEGIGYACALLMDEYERSAVQIEEVLSRAADDMYDEESIREAKKREGNEEA